MLRALVFVLGMLLAADRALADAAPVRGFPPGLDVPAAAQPGPDFDVDRATQAWLAKLTPEQRAQSDRYFEGGYWLRLWGALWWIGAMALLLATGASRRMRERAERWVRRPALATMLYAAWFVVASFLLVLPLAIYAGFVREHEYGLSNLSFPGWLRERLIALAVTLVVATPLVALLYAGVRRAGSRWWIWATGITFAFSLAIGMLYPVFLAPLFNRYEPLADGPVREAVLSLARANGVPADRIERFDASKQTTRVSANVAGLGGTARIALNDNLLERTSLPEIRAVVGHEIGHYVLGHIVRNALYTTLLVGGVLAALSALLDRALARRGTRLGLRDRADPAGLPLAAAIYAALMLLLTPVSSTIIRTAEAEADAYGLNAAREPQGFAMAALRLSTYRKLAPGPLEEFVFYDHPSGHDRIRRAMTWQKENLPAAPMRAP